MRFFLILSLVFSQTLQAQTLQVTSGAIPVDGGYDYLVTNNEPVAVTIQLQFELKNLKSNMGKQQLFLVPAFATDYKVLELRMKRADSYGYRVSASYVYGDQRNGADEYAYHLPYASSASYRVSQGYNGNSTHRGKYAIDFMMPIGTPVHAARDGIVVEVEDRNSLGCTQPKCVEYANYIRILHTDGTIAEYTHLKVNGSKVYKGQTVQANEHIGYSGNTGWTTGPHLHFTVYRPQFGRQSRTIPVRFRLGKSVVVNELLEERSYRKP